MFSNNSMRESSSGGVLQTPQQEINAPGANADVHTFLCYGSSHNSLVALRYSSFHQIAITPTATTTTTTFWKFGARSKIHQAVVRPDQHERKRPAGVSSFRNGSGLYRQGRHSRN